MIRPVGAGLLLLVALCATTQGCFLRRSRGEPRQRQAFADVQLRVTNHNYLDVIVYVIHDGLRTRLGMVTGSSAQVFTLPAHLLGQAREIQLYGDPIGSEDFALTELLLVQPGERLEWTLESDLRRSSVGIF
jgi:hypothetical protein